MPRFALICIDKPQSLDLRMANRPAHLAYVEARRSELKVAGPFLDEAGAMAGSLLIVEAADSAAVWAFSADDPYAKAGLFATVEVRRLGGGFDKL